MCHLWDNNLYTIRLISILWIKSVWVSSCICIFLYIITKDYCRGIILESFITFLILNLVQLFKLTFNQIPLEVVMYLFLIDKHLEFFLTKVYFTMILIIMLVSEKIYVVTFIYLQVSHIFNFPSFINFINFIINSRHFIHSQTQLL